MRFQFSNIFSSFLVSVSWSLAVMWQGLKLEFVWKISITLRGFFGFSFVCLFVFGHAQNRPGIKPKPQRWQCQILNTLSHQETPISPSLKRLHLSDHLGPSWESWLDLFAGKKGLSDVYNGKTRVPWRFSRLRTWHCHCHGSGCCCGTGSSPGPGLLHAMGMAEK